MLTLTMFWAMLTEYLCRAASEAEVLRAKSMLANMQEHTVFRISAFALVCKLQLLNLQGMYSV